jgi:hypothetical protein
MEVSQGNSLYRYLKQEKCHFFSSLFLMQNLKRGVHNRPCLRGLVPVVGEIGERSWEGEHIANIVYTSM